MAEPEFTWMVGGQSGEGIDTTGELFALCLCRLGYRIFAYRHFPSRIRGGHTHYMLRIAGWPVRAPAEEIDCLVAFDQGSVDFNWQRLRQGGMVVHDAAFHCRLPPSRPDLTAYPVPMSDLAAETGAVIMKNMVAVGVSAFFLGLPPDPFASVVERRFAGKGAEVAAANAELVRRGHAFAAGHHRPALRCEVAPDPVPAGSRYLMSGNEALAYGALAAGCRFVAAYPITPATEIMQWLARELKPYGGTVVQCEDELAAVNMAVGAAYAGARALASTSGPGFSLMTEGMGLAGATEQPIVIVDDQRGGPSTGLPTKTEQADLDQAIYGGHGEFPRIVLAPLTVEDCFDAAVDAFNLAEAYQCPVILLPDLSLAMCKQTIDGLDFQRVRVDRGSLADPEDLAVAGAGRFHRYEVTESGISPRAFPGQAGGQHLVTGTEHDPTGTVSDTPGNRAAQQSKRLRKLLTQPWPKTVRALETSGLPAPGEPDAELLLVGFGSTAGVLEEARQILTAKGHRVARLSVRVPHPFPRAEVAAVFARAQAALVVECNAEGQLERLLRQEGCVPPAWLPPAGPAATDLELLQSPPPAGGAAAAGPAPWRCLRRWDGNPILAAEVVEAARSALETVVPR